jgi:hypothetical protein
MRVNGIGLGLFLSLLTAAEARAQDASAAGGGRPPDVAAEAPRPYRLRADLGGTEPGTSRQAFEANVAHRGATPWEWQVGYTYSDQVYYQSNRGYLTLYRFFEEGMSYVKGDATLRRYDYPVDATVQRPNPDSSSYEWVPRAEVEASHWFMPAVRAGVQYQLFPANFFYDTSSWTVNQKVAGDVEVWPLRTLHLGVKAALLRDPDPGKTEILGRPIPGDPGSLATATNVVYQTQTLVGGWAEVALAAVGAKLEYLPNRDLDGSYDWSLLSTLWFRPAPSVEVKLEEVHDTYSNVSSFPGSTADIYMGTVAWEMSPALRLRGGYRYVDAPNRTGGTIVAGLEWRTGF